MVSSYIVVGLTAVGVVVGGGGGGGWSGRGRATTESTTDNTRRRPRRAGRGSMAGFACAVVHVCMWGGSVSWDECGLR